MPATNRDIINSAMGASQDPNFDDIQSAMGGGQYAPVIQLLRALSLSSNQAATGQPYTATVASLYTGTDYLQRVQDDRDGVSITGSTLSGTFATVVPDITITEALYAKTAERGTVAVQAGQASVKVTGPSTIVEGTGEATAASVAVIGPATIVEGTSSSSPASVAVTGASTIVEGN